MIFKFKKSSLFFHQLISYTSSYKISNYFDLFHKLAFQMHASRLIEIEPAPLSNSDILKKAASMTLEHSSPETMKNAQRSRVVNVKGKT